MLIVDNHSMAKQNDLVQGTLDLLILKTSSLEPKHGWAIAKRIQQISGEVLQVQQGGALGNWRPYRNLPFGG